MEIYKDIYYRPERGELHVIKEQSQYSKLNFEDKVIMDIGANIGAFARYAVERGAKQVYCYEPCPETFELLTRNRRAKIEIFQKAIAKEPGEIEFFLHKKYPSCHTTVPVKGRESIKVKALSFMDELNRVQPSVVKIDIEGEELNLEPFNLPVFVEEVAIEFHMKNEKQIQKVKQILAESFSDWYVHRKFRFTWHVTTPVLSRVRKSNLTVKTLLKEIENGNKGS